MICSVSYSKVNNFQVPFKLIVFIFLILLWLNDIAFLPRGGIIHF